MSRRLLPSLRVAALLSATPMLVVAAPKDEEARALAERAMQGDYLATRFKDAENKLQKALKLCSKKKCSSTLKAELHRDLAVVYLAGSKKRDKGKKEMRAAIAADPAVQLDPDFSSPEVEKAFVAAGGVKPQPESLPEPEPEPAPPMPSTPPAAVDEPESTGPVRNWLSLTFQQELLVYGATQNVCSESEQYHCFLSGKSYTGSIFDGSGNELQGGAGLATRRVLLGYDRVLGHNVSLGARLGFAFAGSPKPSNGEGGALLPVHAELRGSYWLGDSPFASSGLRGYLGLAAGLGEVDGRVTVEYFVDQAGYMQNTQGKLDAWRRTGPGFVGLHLGVGYALSRHHALLLELRLLQMLPKSGQGGALSLSYAFGT